jgi:hypothetical protein
MWSAADTDAEPVRNTSNSTASNRILPADVETEKENPTGMILVKHPAMIH